MLAKLREIRGEKIQKIVEFFALILICPWCVNECKSKYVYFFLLKASHVAILQNDSGVEWSRWYCIQYIISIIAFSGPLNCPMFYLKVAYTFPLIHKNLVYFHVCRRTEPPVVPDLVSFDATFRLMFCMPFCSILDWLCYSCEAASQDISVIPGWIC